MYWIVPLRKFLSRILLGEGEMRRGGRMRESVSQSTKCFFSNYLYQIR
jgi:hypothetical protein